jgi:hypothetical protein
LDETWLLAPQQFDEPIPDRRPPLRRGISSEIVKPDLQRSLAGRQSEDIAPSLGVQMNVLSEPLGNHQPDVIGRENEGVVCGVRQVNSADESVELARQEAAVRRAAGFGAQVLRTEDTLDGHARRQRFHGFDAGALSR